MIAETLFNVAKELFGIFSNLEEKKIQRRIRIADYFSNLAQIIEDTSAYLKKGEYPHGECESLRLHAEMMVPTIKDAVGEADANEYASRVLSVWEIERMYDELLNVSDAEKSDRLTNLDEAAGYFRAVAAHLRISA